MSVDVYEADDEGPVAAAMELGLLGKIDLKQMEGLVDGVLSRVFERVAS